MISPTELESMRSTAEAWMPDTIDVYDRQETDDGRGGTTTSYLISQAGLRCRVTVPRSFPEFQIADQVQGGGSYTIAVPHDSVIDPNARLLYRGDWLEIEQPLEPRSHEIQRLYTARRIN